MKDLFSIFINSKNNEYTVEKIYGIPAITLYLDELLTETILINLKIQLKEYKMNQYLYDIDIDIYSNYSNKSNANYLNLKIQIIYTKV